MKKKKSEGLKAVIESVRELQKELGELEKILAQIERPPSTGNGSVKAHSPVEEDFHG